MPMSTGSSMGSGSSGISGLVEDKEIAARAVAFVVNSSRRGIVPLCADVASILASKRHLERKLQSLEQENRVLRSNLVRSSALNSPRPSSQCSACSNLQSSPPSPRKSGLPSRRSDDKSINSRVYSRSQAAARRTSSVIKRQGAFSLYDSSADELTGNGSDAELHCGLPFPGTDDPPQMTSEIKGHVRKISPATHISREIQCFLNESCETIESADTLSRTTDHLSRTTDLSRTTVPSQSRTTDLSQSRSTEPRDHVPRDTQSRDQARDEVSVLEEELSKAREEISILRARLHMMESCVPEQIRIENEVSPRPTRHHSLPNTPVRGNSSRKTRKDFSESDPAGSGGHLSETTPDGSDGHLSETTPAGNGSHLLEPDHEYSLARVQRVENCAAELYDGIPLSDMSHLSSSGHGSCSQNSLDQPPSSAVTTCITTSSGGTRAPSPGMTSSCDVEAGPASPTPIKSTSFCQRIGLRRKKPVEKVPVKKGSKKNGLNGRHLEPV